MKSETLKVYKDIVELDVTQKELDDMRLVGSLYIPGNAGGNAKLLECKIKQINKDTSDKFGINVGDIVRVDRYAIIQINKNSLEKEYHALIEARSIVFKKLSK